MCVCMCVRERERKRRREYERQSVRARESNTQGEVEERTHLLTLDESASVVCERGQTKSLPSLRTQRCSYEAAVNNTPNQSLLNSSI